jgi:glutaredoxin
MKYQIYGTPTCGFCSSAIKLLESKGLEHEYIDLTDVSDKTQDRLMAIAGHQFRTVPQIFSIEEDKRFGNKNVIDMEYVGGFTELKESLS